MWNMKKWMHGKKKNGMYHRGVIMAWCVVFVNGGDVGLLTWLRGRCPMFWSYKTEGRRSRLAQQLVCHLSVSLLYTRYVSYQQSCLWTFHGAPNLSWGRPLPYAYQRWTALPVKSTGKVLYRFGLINLTRVLIVGGPCHWGQRGYYPGGKLRVY